MVYDILRCVKHFIIHNHLLAESSSVIVGVSGGKDSVCLAHILLRLSLEFQWKLFLVHFNHKQRGVIADQDALWVCDLAQKWGLSCFVDVLPQDLEGQTLNENILRQKRYHCFKQKAQSLKAMAVAVGHHQDDQAETVLHHLMRGTHFRGLRGMPLKRALYGDDSIQLVRPLLCLSQEDIDHYAKEQGLSWREDASNRQSIYLRNRIRHQLLPLLKTYNTKISKHLNDLAKFSQDIFDWMSDDYQEREKELFSCFHGQKVLNLVLWKKLKPSLANDILYRMLQEHKSALNEITLAHVHELAKICLSSKTWIKTEFLSGIFCCKSYHYLKLSSVSNQDGLSWADKDIAVPGEVFVQGLGKKLLCRTIPSKQIPSFVLPPNETQQMYCDQSKVQGSLKLVKARLKDIFIPLGMKNLQTVQSFCSLQQIVHWERSYLHFVKDQEKVLWLIGWRMDERVRCGVNTKKILHLQLRM